VDDVCSSRTGLLPEVSPRASSTFPY